jgi:hypothetical protein
VTAPQTSFTERVDALAPARRRQGRLRDIAVWLAVAVVTLTLASVAVTTSEVVGPATLPWWPAQNLSLHVTAGMVVAPLTAAAVLVAASRPAAARMSWNALLVLSYLASITWSAALHTNVDPTTMSTATAGARHAIALLVSYTGSEAGLAVAVVSLSCLTVPLTLVAVKSVSGPVAARALAPVLILGPWAAWSTLGIDGIAAAACAAVLACGAVVSERRMKGPDAFWGAAAAGGLLGIAALLSYGAAWFAVSLLCLFFARRRPAQILVAAGAALAVLAVAATAGHVAVRAGRHLQRGHRRDRGAPGAAVVARAHARAGPCGVRPGRGVEPAALRIEHGLAAHDRSPAGAHDRAAERVEPGAARIRLDRLVPVAHRGRDREIRPEADRAGAARGDGRGRLRRGRAHVFRLIRSRADSSAAAVYRPQPPPTRGP